VDGTDDTHLDEPTPQPRDPLQRQEPSKLFL